MLISAHKVTTQEVINIKIPMIWTSSMAQLVKSLAAKPGDLSLILSMYMVERTVAISYSLTSTCVLSCTPPQIDREINNAVKRFNSNGLFCFVIGVKVRKCQHIYLNPHWLYLTASTSYRRKGEWSIMRL